MSCLRLTLATPREKYALLCFPFSLMTSSKIGQPYQILFWLKYEIPCHKKIVLPWKQGDRHIIILDCAEIVSPSLSFTSPRPISMIMSPMMIKVLERIHQGHGSWGAIPLPIQGVSHQGKSPKLQYYHSTWILVCHDNTGPFRSALMLISSFPPDKNESSTLLSATEPGKGLIVFVFYPIHQGPQRRFRS